MTLCELCERKSAKRKEREFDSYCPSHQKRFRHAKKDELAAALGHRNFKVSWGAGVEVLSINITNKAGTEKTVADVAAAKLSKKQTRAMHLPEAKIQQHNKEERFSIPVYDLVSDLPKRATCHVGAFCRLTEKLAVLWQLYPHCKQWRILYNYDARGYITAVIGPILQSLSDTLSSENIWKLAIWRGKDSEHFVREWVGQAQLAPDIQAAVGEFFFNYK